jgi:protein O-GlcNAc transferase
MRNGPAERDRRRMRDFLLDVGEAVERDPVAEVTAAAAAAEPACRLAAMSAPGDPRQLFLLGIALHAQRRMAEAKRALRRAVALADPALRLRIGNLLRLSELDDVFDVALEAYAAATADPDNADALGAAFFTRRLVCDWRDHNEAEVLVKRAVLARPSASTLPLVQILLDASDDDRLAAARAVSQKLAAAAWAFPPPSPGSGRRPVKKLRIGYLSTFNQPITALLSGVIEHHDRDRFEVCGYSYAVRRGAVPAQQTRLVRAFERFTDLSELPDRAAAERIRRDRIDILLDLDTWLPDARPAIAAHRPASVQVNYLGVPSTSGAPWIDFVLVDRFIVPPESKRHYSEQVVWLPDCYQPNDNKRQIAEPARLPAPGPTPSRASCGLPETGFVFANLGMAAKITPAMFALWMRLLQAAPASALWLLEWHRPGQPAPQLRNNLRDAAARRGVDPDRLVFAPQLPGAGHLARFGLASLMLDTNPCGQHTLASDALWPASLS